MTKRSIEQRIDDILQAIYRIEEYIAGVSEEKFMHTLLIQDAVLRQISIIGEATKYIGDDIRKKFPQIEWSDIVATRNFVDHEYADVDLQLVWGTLKKDLPELKKVLKNLKQ